MIKLALPIIAALFYSQPLLDSKPQEQPQTVSPNNSEDKWLVIQQPGVCAVTSVAAQYMKDLKYSPIIKSELNDKDVHILLVIWLDPNDKVEVTTTKKVENVSLTCIIGLGEDNTQFYKRGTNL